MKRILVMALPVIVYASVTNEVSKVALLTLTKSIGQVIYQQCIITPPSNQEQIEKCTDLYFKKYLPNEILLTLPNTVKPSLEISPYSKSGYDICRNETGHVIFSENIPGMPYCPTIPK